MYARAKEQKQKVCTINSQNKNQEIGVQVTLISEIKSQMYILYENMIIISDLCIHFEPRLGWDCGHACHNLRTGKEGIYNREI